MTDLSSENSSALKLAVGLIESQLAEWQKNMAERRELLRKRVLTVGELQDAQLNEFKSAEAVLKQVRQGVQSFCAVLRDENSSFVSRLEKTEQNFTLFLQETEKPAPVPYSHTGGAPEVLQARSAAQHANPTN